MKKLPTLLIVAAALYGVTGYAQTKKIVADKIVAQIGDRIILNSDLDTAWDLELNRNTTPFCHLLENQLMQKALAIQAAKDSILTDDEFDALLDNQVRNLMTEYGGKKSLEDAAQKSVYQIKEQLRGPFKERAIADGMRNRIFAAIKITPAEVKEYFEKIPKDSLPYFKDEAQINQLVIHPEHDKDIEKYETGQLLKWKQDVESGKQKFDVLAKLYSQYPGSSYNGGQYAVNREDRHWDPTWFATIWKLKEGQVSPVIQSKFGLSIIQMVSRAGDGAVIRHILLLHNVTQAAVDKATLTLDSVRSQVLAGKMSVEAALSLFNDKSDGNNLPETIKERQESPGTAELTTGITIEDLKNMNAGDILQPEVYKDGRSQQAVRLIFVRARKKAHQENWQDDYDKIAQQALEQKKNRVLQQWFKQHIPALYISIDKDYGNCDNVVALVGK